METDRDPRIRLMESKDIPCVLDIQNESNLSFWSLNEYENVISDPNAIALIAEIDSRCVGFIVVRLLVSGDSSEIKEANSSSGEAEILNFAVAKHSRCNGLGTKILDRLISDITGMGISKIFLEVRDSNTVARRFYENRGFTTLGIRKRYYSLPVEDAVIMRLKL